MHELGLEIFYDELSCTWIITVAESYLNVICMEEINCTRAFLENASIFRTTLKLSNRVQCRVSRGQNRLTLQPCGRAMFDHIVCQER